MTSTLPENHRAFLDGLRKVVENDGRFHALLAGGSLVHGGFDEQSDLDLVVVADDAAYDDVLADRKALAARLGPLLSAFTGEHVGEPRLLICLYGPPLLHVDLKFVTGADLDRRIERPAVLFAREPDAVRSRLAGAAVAWPDRSPQWFEDRAWIWLHYGASKFARGELFEAIGMLAFLREQVIGPLLHRRAGRPQRGVRRIENHGLDPEGLLEGTLARHERASVAAALRAAADAYLHLRADEPPAQPTKSMPAALFEMLQS